MSVGSCRIAELCSPFLGMLKPATETGHRLISIGLISGYSLILVSLFSCYRLIKGT
jgi:hypothetical protein